MTDVTGLGEQLFETPELEVREGFHRHHRKKDRSDNSPTNILYVGPKLHEWIETHPEDARELGWWVDSWQDPEEVPVTIPDVLPTKKRAKKDPEAPRNRVAYTFKVPKDEQENGADILDTLIDECRDSVKDVLGFEGDVPTYYVLVAVLHDWLTDNSWTSLEKVPTK